LQAQDRITLLLDWFVNPDHGPIIIAQEKGYFADAGLEVEVIAPADPADPPKMVAAGKADLAVSYQPQLHLQVAEDMPLVRVGTLVATPLNCLLVLKDGKIKSIADLKGKKVGRSPTDNDFGTKWPVDDGYRTGECELVLVAIINVGTG